MTKTPLLMGFLVYELNCLCKLFFVSEHVPQANVNTRHQENSDDSENTRKRSDLNSEPTDPSTDSSPKAPSSE
jgi:hypothetical protein